MVYAASPDLIRALQGNHEMVCRVDVFDSNGMRAVDLPIEDGQINASLLSNVSRTGALTVSRRLIEQGLFNPDWDRVRVSTGVRGYPLVPIFTGRVQDNDIAHTDRSVTVSLADFGDDLVSAPFERPWVVKANRSVLSEMVNIIHDVDRDFTVDLTDVLDGKTPDVAWSDNRAQALDQLATGIGAIWQATRSGGFVIFRNPYQQATPPAAVMALSDGPGGSITRFREIRSRREVYNSITLEVQRADGGQPVRVTVRDNRTQSRTRWGGPFGKRNRRLQVQTPYSETEAKRVATRILGQSLALARSWSLSTPHFPLLDPGDVIAVSYENRIWAQVIESISYPLLAIDQTSLSTRELILFNDNVEDSSAGFFPGFSTPPDPVPEEPTTMLLGMSAPNGQPTQSIVAEYAPQYMRNFGSDSGDADSLPELGNKFTGKWFDAPNTLMHTSWKDDVSELSTWLDDLDRPIYLSWYHEPHGDIDPALFRATCETMVSIIDAHPNKALVLGNGPVVTRYHLDEGGGSPTTWGYNGMTFYGIDCYSQDFNTYWTPQQIFVPTFTKVREAYPGIKLMVPEYGIVRINSDTTGVGRANAIKSHIRWLRTQPDVLAVAYFNAAGSIPAVPFTVNTPEGQAWKELMAEQ